MKKLQLYYDGIQIDRDLLGERIASRAECATCDWKGTTGEYFAACDELNEHRRTDHGRERSA